MLPANRYKIPEEISNDKELRAWYEQELEKLGDERPLEKEINLLRTIVSKINRSVETERNDRFDRSASNYYKGLLVSALMAKGWESKKSAQGNKRMGQDAIRVFREALRLTPENPKACYRLGHLMKSKGDIGQAVGYFSKALELARKQSRFQEDLKLNDAQIANASGQSIALLQSLTDSFEQYIEFTFDLEQIAALQNLVRYTWDKYVVYSTKVGGSIESKTIDINEYDEMTIKFKCDPKAFIIDRYNSVSLIRYLNEELRYVYDTPSSGKLNYLLKAIGFENWDPDSVKQNTINQNVLRVNNDLKEIGVDKWVDIGYSRADGVSKFSARCDLTVHYFKTLLD